jgi:hypothetical protein
MTLRSINSVLGWIRFIQLKAEQTPGGSLMYRSASTLGHSAVCSPPGTPPCTRAKRDVAVLALDRLK